MAEVTNPFQFYTSIEALDQETQKYTEISQGCYRINKFYEDEAVIQSCITDANDAEP